MCDAGGKEKFKKGGAVLKIGVTAALALWALTSWMGPAFAQCPALAAPTATPQVAPSLSLNPASSTAVPVPNTSNLVAPIPDTSNLVAPGFSAPVDCNPPPPPSVVNGACGPANGVAVLSAPTSGFCSAGTPTTVSGAGPWAWSCLGSNGGTNAACSAPLSSGSPTIVTMGETTVFPETDGQNGGFLMAQDAVLLTGGTVRSLSFFVDYPEGQLRLNLWDAKGTNGRPRNLLAQTATFTPVMGWNTMPVITPVPVIAGNYWLAYNPGSGGLNFRVERDHGICVAARLSLTSALPSTFPTITGDDTCRWSFYATLN